MKAKKPEWRKMYVYGEKMTVPKALFVRENIKDAKKFDCTERVGKSAVHSFERSKYKICEITATTTKCAEGCARALTFIDKFSKADVQVGVSHAKKLHADYLGIMFGK